MLILQKENFYFTKLLSHQTLMLERFLCMDSPCGLAKLAPGPIEIPCEDGGRSWNKWCWMGLSKPHLGSWQHADFLIKENNYRWSCRTHIMSWPRTPSLDYLQTKETSNKAPRSSTKKTGTISPLKERSIPWGPNLALTLTNFFKKYMQCSSNFFLFTHSTRRHEHQCHAKHCCRYWGCSS